MRLYNVERREEVPPLPTQKEHCKYRKYQTRYKDQRKARGKNEKKINAFQANRLKTCQFNVRTRTLPTAQLSRRFYQKKKSAEKLAREVISLKAVRSSLKKNLQPGGAPPSGTCAAAAGGSQRVAVCSHRTSQRTRIRSERILLFSPPPSPAPRRLLQSSAFWS
jgi:hypothetical protein